MITYKPWHVGPHYKSDVESEDGRVCECTPFESPRARANAILISATPDLLEACRGVETVYAELQAALPAIANTAAFDLVAGAVKAARAAIAKAEGRSA